MSSEQTAGCQGKKISPADEMLIELEDGTSASAVQKESCYCVVHIRYGIIIAIRRQMQRHFVMMAFIEPATVHF